MDRNAKVFVAGHRGLVGSALVRRLKEKGFNNLLLKTRPELDLTNQQAVEAFFEIEQPEYVFLAAAKVGGIYANSAYPADFLYANLSIQTNVINSAYQNGTKKLVFLGSSCIYPKMASQPIKEEYLLTGALEPTNEAYALAKISGLKMCEAYRRQYGFNAVSVMPTNLYGPGDNYDLENSHVIPALIRKAHEAKVSGASEMVVWGTGKAMREFLYVDDMADATIHAMMHYEEDGTINVGTGKDLTIRDLVETIVDVVGFKGELRWDTGKPDGTPRKVLDVSRMTKLGWQAKTSLRDGLVKTYAAFQKAEV
ncbi:GDP-L-fucose synthase [Kordiimonas laminariae]|uniref:GDP-L-fucose synthase n=1 Tax=Kordiimonas laminariae TaxID=2917717 RepID=UPI001FF65959|nr:GDP-L-fucose synthase [Kordiimonas laminariae]